MSSQLQPVESTHLAGYSYDSTKEELTVQFRLGDIWCYSNVTADLFTRFASANSKGSFFASEIRPRCEGTKVYTGTFFDRMKIWIRSKDSDEFSGKWVALADGNPVRVLGFADDEDAARAAIPPGEGDVMVIRVAAKDFVAPWWNAEECYACGRKGMPAKRADASTGLRCAACGAVEDFDATAKGKK